MLQRSSLKPFGFDLIVAVYYNRINIDIFFTEIIIVYMSLGYLCVEDVKHPLTKSA